MINRTTRGGLYTRRMAIIAGARLLNWSPLGSHLPPLSSRRRAGAPLGTEVGSPTRDRGHRDRGPLSIHVLG
jgi:hypothetical protein